jgi:hypothetical protein
MDFLLVSSEGRSIDDIINDKLKIIKILTLCSSENPTFRQKIGIYKDGKVLKEVISMIDEGDKAAAIAGEAIWIFSFNNLHNHNYFVDNGAIPKMSEIIVTKGKNDKDHNAILAVMWVAAALQNLAASYCDTDSGHCWWEFDDNEDGGLYLHDDSPLVTDGTKAAKEIIKSGLRNDNGDDGENELINIMKSLACREPMTEDDRMWPSLATIDDEITDSRITSWAIVGILKNLSMYSASVHATLSSEDCLCSLTESEDWLVSSFVFRVLHFGRNHLHVISSHLILYEHISINNYYCFEKRNHRKQKMHCIG